MVGMATTPGGGGYWEVASDGGIFSYGDAAFHGSTGATASQPSPSSAWPPRPDGGGYWLVASDGGIFNYGDAGFYGSTGSLHLNKPIVGMAATPDGSGYWLVASDGGIFSYGDAAFLRLARRPAAQQAHRRHGGQPLGARLLAGRLRRWHLHLRRRRLRRLGRVPPPRQADRGDAAAHAAGAATGSWPPTAASSATATPSSTARRADWRWPPPSSPWADHRQRQRSAFSVQRQRLQRLAVDVRLAGLEAQCARRAGWPPRGRGARSGRPCGRRTPRRGPGRPAPARRPHPLPRAASSTTTSSIQARTARRDLEGGQRQHAHDPSRRPRRRTAWWPGRPRCAPAVRRWAAAPSGRAGAQGRSTAATRSASTDAAILDRDHDVADSPRHIGWRTLS